MLGPRSLNLSELFRMKVFCFFNIRVFFKESQETYGSPRIHKEMQEAGFKIGLNRAARIMRKAGLKAGRIYKKQYKRNIKENEAAHSIINQDFSSDAPNQKWVTDITQIRTYEGWLYLATVCDLYSRMIIG